MERRRRTAHPHPVPTPHAFAREVFAALGAEAGRLEIRAFSVGVGLAFPGAVPRVVLTGIPGLRGFSRMRLVAVDDPFGAPRPLGVEGTPATVAEGLRAHPEWLGEAPALSFRDALLHAARAEGEWVTRVEGLTPEVTTLSGDTHDWVGIADLAPPADPFAVRWRGGRLHLLGPARAALGSEPRTARLVARVPPSPIVAPDPALVRVPCGDGLPAFVPASTWDPADVADLDDPVPSLAVARAERLRAVKRPGSALVAVRSVRGWVDDPAWDRAVAQALADLRR
jgi:hypothetical protein